MKWGGGGTFPGDGSEIDVVCGLQLLEESN